MKRKVQRGILHVILYTFVLIMMVPLIWLVVISFKTNREILTQPLQLPSTWSFVNYKEALELLDIFRLFLFFVILSIQDCINSRI